MLAWFVEVIGFSTVLLITHILGHESSLMNSTAQTLTTFIYFVMLPSVMLINTSDFKDSIAENVWYERFLKCFKWQYTNTDSRKGNDIEEKPTCSNNEDNAVENEIIQAPKMEDLKKTIN